MNSESLLVLMKGLLLAEKTAYLTEIVSELWKGSTMDKKSEWLLVVKTAYSRVS